MTQSLNSIYLATGSPLVSALSRNRAANSIPGQPLTFWSIEMVHQPKISISPVSNSNADIAKECRRLGHGVQVVGEAKECRRFGRSCQVLGSFEQFSLKNFEKFSNFHNFANLANQEVVERWRRYPKMTNFGNFRTVGWGEGQKIGHFWVLVIQQP